MLYCIKAEEPEINMVKDRKSNRTFSEEVLGITLSEAFSLSSLEFFVRK